MAISVDGFEKNAALAERLELPFPVLADPGGDGAIKPFQAWHDEEERAKPTTVVLTQDGAEVWRHDGIAPPDRAVAADVLGAVADLSLEPRPRVDVPRLEVAEPTPEGAFPRERIVPFFRPIRSVATYLDDATHDRRAHDLRRLAEEALAALD